MLHPGKVLAAILLSYPLSSPAQCNWSQKTVVNVRDYGVVPGADSGPALIAMRDALRANGRENSYEIRFPYSPNPYQYSNNRWLQGLACVSLVGQPVVVEGVPKRPALQNVNQDKGPAGADLLPFNNQAISHDWFDRPQRKIQPVSDYVFYQGELLTFDGSSGQIGSSYVSVSNAQDYAPGDRILVAGLNQMLYGFPLASRYFEYHEVDHVEGNRLYFPPKQSLTYAYSPAWWDWNYGDFSFGRPRVFRLNRPKYRQPEEIKLRGLRFLPHTNPWRSDVNTSLRFGARFVNYNEIEGDFPQFNIWTIESEKTQILNSVIGGNIEVDKQSDQVLIRGNTIRGLESSFERRADGKYELKSTDWVHSVKSGISCNKLEISNNVLQARLNVLCRTMLVRDNRIDITHHTDNRYSNAFRFYNNEFGGLKAEFVNNTVRKKSAQTVGSPNLIASFPSGSTGAFEASGKFVVQMPITAAVDAVMSFLPGTPLYYLQGSALTSVGAFEKFEARGNQAALVFAWTGAPISSPSLAAFRNSQVQTVIESGTTVEIAP